MTWAFLPRQDCSLCKEKLALDEIEFVQDIFRIGLFLNGARYSQDIDRLIPQNKGAFETSFFAFLGGHLCCVAGFEWSRVWWFFPVGFRALTCLVLSLAFAACLQIWAKGNRGGLLAPILVSWAACFSCPFFFKPGVQSALFIGIGLLACFLRLEKKVLLLGTVLVFLFGVLSMSWSLPWTWFALVLGLGFLLEETFTNREAPTLKSRAQVEWLGLGELQNACAPGEGEKFGSRVLQDSIEVIESFGGVLESGSREKGLYSFENALHRQRCESVLLDYEEQTKKVLHSVNAPAIRLVFENKNK